MKLEINIDNFFSWLNSASASFRLSPLLRAIDNDIFHYEEFIHDGNDGIFLSFLIFNFYLMFD